MQRALAIVLSGGAAMLLVGLVVWAPHEVASGVEPLASAFTAEDVLDRTELALPDLVDDERVEVSAPPSSVRRSRHPPRRAAQEFTKGDAALVVRLVGATGLDATVGVRARERDPWTVVDLDPTTASARLEGLQRGPWRVRVVAIEDGWLACDGEPPAGREIELVQGANEIELCVEQAARIVGSAHTSDGRPLDGAEVRLRSRGGAGRKDLVVESGAFEGFVRAGAWTAELRSVDETDATLPARVEITARSGGSEVVVLVVECGALTMRGRVVDPKGRPVAGLALRLKRSHTIVDELTGIARPVVSTAGRSRTSDHDGRFEFEGLVPATYTVEVDAALPDPFDGPGAMRLAERAEPLTVELVDERAPTSELRVVPASPVRVRGCVVIDEGAKSTVESLRSLTVVVPARESAGGSRRRTFRLARDGSFEFWLESSRGDAWIEIGRGADRRSYPLASADRVPAASSLVLRYP